MRKRFCLSLDSFFGKELRLPQLNCLIHILVTLQDLFRGRKEGRYDCVVMFLKRVLEREKRTHKQAGLTRNRTACDRLKAMLGI